MLLQEFFLLLSSSQKFFLDEEQCHLPAEHRNDAYLRYDDLPHEPLQKPQREFLLIVLPYPDEPSIRRPEYEGDAGYDLFARENPKVVGEPVGKNQTLKALYKSIDYIEYDTKLIIAPTDEVSFYSMVYPRSSVSKYNLAYAYFQSKQYSQSVKYFRKAINSDLDDSRMQDSKLRLADSYFMLSDFKNASRYYEKSTKNNTSQDYALYQESKCYALLSDYRKQEIDNQHSISMSLINFEYLDKKFNLIDTPGYIDFVGEMKAGLGVADLAGIVVNASEGIEVGTELAWEFSSNNKTAKFIVINMCDRDQSDFDKSLNALKKRFGRQIFPINFPLEQGAGFNKIADVLKRKILDFSKDSSGNFSTEQADETTKNKLDKHYEELIELVAESDEALLESFFEKGELSDDELKKGLKNAIISKNLIPVFCKLMFLLLSNHPPPISPKF